jgi:signal transduction histidine kinase
MKKEEDFLSNIYFSNLADIPLVSYVFEFHKQIYVIELNLNFINKLVSNLNPSRINEVGITIVDKNGLYILDTLNKANVKNRSSFFATRFYKEAIAPNPENNLIKYFNDFTGKNNYISYKEFNNFSWTIVVQENNNDIYLYIFNIALVILFFILIIAFITIKSAKKIANSIVNPLEVLTLNINRFSKDHSIKIDDNLRSKYTMFSILIKDFKMMQKSIVKNEQSLKLQIIENQQKDKILSDQSKMAAMGEMMGNIAHQWRQPLSVISTASTGIIMQKEFGTFKEEQLIPTCTTINENAQYLSRTIDDFKNFIKGDRTKKVFSLTSNIHRSLNLLESTIKNHSIHIVYDLDEDILIDGYDNELTQCIINIINNAKDALKSKNVVNKYVFITTYTIENKVIIKIKDNAEGITDDVLPHIFEPYFTTKHKSQGTGLGLHMTYNLITDGMKGSIEAFNVSYDYNDEEYTGTEFIISL